MNELLCGLLGLIATGDDSKPWLIAICLIVSIVVIIAMIILSAKSKKEDKDKE